MLPPRIEAIDPPTARCVLLVEPKGTTCSEEGGLVGAGGGGVCVGGGGVEGR